VIDSTGIVRIREQGVNGNIGNAIAIGLLVGPEFGNVNDIVGKINELR